MSPRVALLLIALHPLALAAWILDGLLPGTWSVVQAAVVVEWMLTAWLVMRARPLFARPPEAHVVRAPRTSSLRVDGFTASLQAPRDGRQSVLALLVGLGSSTIGILAGLIVSQSEPAVIVGGLMAHLMAQGLLLMVVQDALVTQRARETRCRVALSGRVLRVGDRSIVLTNHTELTLDEPDCRLDVSEAGQRVSTWAEVAELRWVHEHLSTIEGRGDATEIPSALHQVVRRPE